MSATLDVSRLLSQAANVKFSFVVEVALLLYDTVINMSDEVKEIWLQRCSIGKVFYVVTRYTNFLDAIILIWYSFDAGLTIESCRRMYEVGLWSTTFGIALCHVVLIVRTYALWERNNYVISYLFAIQLGTFVLEIFQLKRSLSSTTFTISPAPSIAPCIPTLGNNNLFFVFVVVMVFEFNILGLLIYKGVSQWRRDSMPLIHTLYRDGFIYFAVLFSASLSNLIIVKKFFDSPYYYVTVELQHVLHTILTSRLIINLRKVIAQSELSQRFSDRFSDGVFENSIRFADGVQRRVT